MLRELNGVMKSGLVETLIDENEGELPVLTASEVLLVGLRSPVWLLWAMTLPFSLAMVMLGHPGFALAALVANMTSDVLAQTVYGRLAAAAGTRSEDWIMHRMIVVLGLRSMCAIAAPAAMAVSSGGTAEILFAATMACMLLGVATTQGGLSRGVFWASAVPVAGALSLIAVVTLPPLQAAALLLALTLLCAMMGIMAGAALRLLGDWSTMREKNNSLIARLRAERALAEEAREEARLAGQAKANFLATMSHEIRTPMNGVLGMAQLLRRSVAEGDQQRQVDTLIHSGEFLLSILNDILDISKIDAGRMEITARAEPIRTVLEGLAALWAPTAEEKGLYLKLEIADEVPEHVRVDARRLRQVLFNLIGNAMKFTEAGGVTLKVDCRPLEEGRIMLRLAIRDTGIGIDPTVLPTLFERFSQVDQSISRPHGGAGLGLSISRQLLQLMGGEICAESQVGEGACFHVGLPVEVVSMAATTATTPADCPATETERALSVLIVDDNPVNLMVLAQILAAFGHEATQAASGPEALELAAARPFDLILLDIQMPGMSGVEAIAALRATEGPNKDVPALAVTADVLSRDRRDYLSLGFSGHVSKPIQVMALASEIATVMDAQTLAVEAA